MSIICIEGASGVGKTTVSNFLQERYGFRRIAEVNELFKRPESESKTWYFERQVERWKLAKRISESGKIAILDGDPFQPVWYNAIYINEGIQSLNEVIEYYYSKIVNGEIELPHKYFILHTSEENLRKRKESDRSRNRRNFEKHLELIEPQKAYFSVLPQALVHFLENDSVNVVSQCIAESELDNAQPYNEVSVFNRVTAFVEYGIRK